MITTCSAQNKITLLLLFLLKICIELSRTHLTPVLVVVQNRGPSQVCALTPPPPRGRLVLRGRTAQAAPVPLHGLQDEGAPLAQRRAGEVQGHRVELAPSSGAAV